MPAGTVLLVMVGALATAALLNAGPMLERAQASELGPGRDIRLGFWEPLEAFSSSLGLDLPRAALDALRDTEGVGEDRPGVEIVAGAAPRGRLGHEPLDLPPAGPSAADDEATAERDATAPAAPVVPSPMIRPDRADAAGATATPLGLPPTGAGDAGDVSAEPPDPGGHADAATVPAPPEPGADAGDGTASTEQAADDTAPPADEAVPPASPFPLRRPTSEAPLRVLIVGDSTMDAVGSAMLRDLSTTGVTDARLDYRVSTGLSRPDFFDWPAHLREIRAAEATEVIVIMIGANDAQPILVEGEVEQHGSDRWSAAYRGRVAALLDELAMGDSWVIWIGQPVMRNDPYDARLRGLNQIYAEEVARYPNAIYVDPRPLTSAEDGSYTAYLPDAEGNQELIRQSDGVHLTPAGGDRISPIVIEAINRIAPLY